MNWRINEVSSLGPIKIEKSTEYQEAPLSHMEAEEGNLMISRSTGQMVRMPLIPKDLPPLPAIVDSQSPILIDFLYPSKLLRRKIRFYLENIEMLKTKITQGRFDWHNQSVLSHLTPDQKEGIGSSSVTFIQLAVARPNYSLAMVCFWYCFAGAYVGQRQPIVSFLYNEVDTIDLKANEGVVKLSNSGNLIIYGMELISSSIGKADTGRLMTGIIPGYKFSQYIEERYPIRSLRSLRESRESTPPGSRFIVWIVGSKYQATRDDFIKYQVDRTIQRHLDFFYSQSTVENPSLILKRKIQEDEFDKGNVSETKRVKIAH